MDTWFGGYLPRLCFLLTDPFPSHDLKTPEPRVTSSVLGQEPCSPSGPYPVGGSWHQQELETIFVKGIRFLQFIPR